MTRVCVCCRVEQPLSEYHRSPNTRSGRISRCRTCINTGKKVDRTTPEGRKRHADNNRRWYHQHKERARAQGKRSAIRCAYRITLEQAEALRIKQNHLCALCGKQRKLVVDHDHKTKDVRAMLCRACNVAIGNLGDTIEGLERAIEYLKRPPAIVVEKSPRRYKAVHGGVRVAKLPLELWPIEA
ncbi:MAG: endonuclease VII domain-containing protein [Rhodomicrobium sp.]